MENYLTQITNYLVTQSWQIAILVAVIAAASWLLKNKSAHVRYLLWLIVLAKCLVPPLLTVPVAVLPHEELAETIPIPAVRMPAAAFEVADGTATESNTLPSAPGTTPAPPTATERPARLTTRQWLGFVWIVGVAAFAVFAVINALRTNFWLWRQRKPLEAKLQNGIENLFSDLSFKTFPKVWLVEGIGQPFVWGLLRGNIYLPADFVKVDCSEHRRVILGHELSHVLRFDAAINFLQIIAQAIFWFHPFVWWANKKMRAEREKCCDEMAIARFGGKAKDYSDAIVNILISEHESVRPVPSLAVAGPVKNIEERIKTMLRPGKKFYKHPSLVAATFVLLLALLTVPTALVLTTRAETEPNAEAKEKSPTTPGPATAEGKAAATAALFRAIDNKNTARVKSVVAQGADLEAKNKDGCTPLYAAVAVPGGNSAIVKLLLQAGANPNARDPRGQTPLHAAARDWQISVVEQLISAGSDVNARDKKGVNPAVIAFELGHTDMFELMVANGATVSTDLMSAYKGDLSQVQSLIENGRAQETFGRGLTLLHAAAAGGHRPIAELLLTNGLDVHSETQAGYTALHHAAAGNHREVAELLLARGADVNAEEIWNGWSYTTPSYLLPDVHPKPANQTPLHWAVRGGHKDTIEWLLARGANPNADGGDYHPLGSPLHWAIWCGNVETAVLLVSHGADIHRNSHNYPYTPLFDSVLQGNPAMAEALISKTGDTVAAKWAPFHATVVAGDLQAIEDLLAKGADVNAKSDRGLSALHSAAVFGHKDIVELLIEKGADVNAKAERSMWDEGMTALHGSCVMGRKGVAELLIAKGADVNAKTKNGYTPLHIAATEGYRDMAELLIAKGADVNEKDYYGRIPLSLAKNRGRTEIIELLRKHGAKE